MAVAPEVIQRARGRVGTVLNGKWRLERMLGIGGMAAVYAAVHRNQNRVAIKMLHPELSIDENVKTRFLREGYAANTVGHIGAVAVYDDDVTPDGAAFLVMELLQGETLDDRADRKGGKLPAGEVLYLADQLLDVLAAAHERGILHRDVKPDNLILTTAGQLKVLDFGIARLRELAVAYNAEATGAGTFMGTPAFMSPEQARGRWDELDARADIWSVGATLYTLLSGNAVHEADSVTDQLVLAATAHAPSLESVAPELPRPLIELVDRALSYEKQDRWPSARSMQIALREVSALVAPAADITAPRVSLGVLERDRSADTVPAPPEVISDITGNHPQRVSKPGSLVSSVTSSPGAALKTRTRTGLFALAGLGALAALIVVLAVRSRSKDEVTQGERSEPASLPAASAAALAQAERSSSSSTSAESAPARLPEPAPNAAAQADAGIAAPRTAPAPAPAQTHSRRSRARVQRPRPPAPASASAAPPPAPEPAPAPAPTFDPFDKRY